eukprot:1151616-Pelagomonas_calceolata.AAC.10
MRTLGGARQAPMKEMMCGCCRRLRTCASSAQRKFRLSNVSPGSPASGCQGSVRSSCAHLCPSSALLSRPHASLLMPLLQHLNEQHEASDLSKEINSSNCSSSSSSSRIMNSCGKCTYAKDSTHGGILASNLFSSFLPTSSVSSCPYS